MLSESTQKKDGVALRLQAYATNILVAVFGLLPLICIPIIVAPFEYTKVIIVLIALCAGLVLYSLSVLRSGVVSVGISYPLVALWSAAIIAGVSSLLSGDLKDSLVGDFFSIHSSIFVAILALVPTVWMLIRPSKVAIMKTYLLFAASAIVLVSFHTLRLFFGADFLSFGIFLDTVSSPVGTWNDLALFLGLTIILALVSLEQLKLTKIGKVFFGVVVALSLCLLTVINFFTVWVVIGLASLVLVVYTLGKERFSGAQLTLVQNDEKDITSLVMSLVVFFVSALFVIGGSVFGGWVSGLTQINYVEVRPSLEATSNIARSVYAENAVLGIGPNKFVDAWRMYKDSSINATVFWNTDFRAGSGYITTFFVTTGVLGGLAWLTFLISYFVVGVRRLFSAGIEDKTWYFIAVSSFVSALYIWGVSVLYVPGPVILLMGAFCTGISLRAFTMLSGTSPKEIAMGANRRTGFALTLAVILVIVASISAVYIAVRHYGSIYTFNRSVVLMQEGTSIAELEREVMDAYTLSTSDVFARRIAEYQLARLNTLIQTSEPTEEQAREFNEAGVNGIRFAQEAIRIDAAEPANWAVLADMYSVLALANVEGATDRAREALAQYRVLDPQSPLPHVKAAIVEIRAADYDLARSYINSAIALKADYTEALYLLAQLAVLEGNVAEAIDSTLSIITFEPQNPTRYYQLGVLESSRNNVRAAITAFENAVALDQNYANARYLLAFAYDLNNEPEKAREQLEAVLALNPGNQDIMQLLEVLDTEGSFSQLRSQASGVVSEAAPTTSETGNVSTSEDADTSLVTPVNTPPRESDNTPE